MADTRTKLDALYDVVQSREPRWTEAAFELGAKLALIGDLPAARQVMEAIIDDADDPWSRARAHAINTKLLSDVLRSAHRPVDNA